MPIPSPTSTAVTVHTRPDMTRPDAGIVAVSEFQVGGADQQQALFDASRAAWDSLPWPETLLSIAWLASLDGQSALAYVQWRDESEFEAYGRTHRPILAARLKAAIPELAPAAPVFYRRYRSGTRPDAPEPGCIVAVSVEFDGPDEARQRAWVDAVFDALASEADAAGRRHRRPLPREHRRHARPQLRRVGRRGLASRRAGAVGHRRHRFGAEVAGGADLPWPEGQPRDAVSARSAPGTRVCRRSGRMTGPLRVAVIIGSTRPGRLGPAVAGWFADQAVPRDDVTIDVIDLADIETPVGPRLASADAFVVVTPEYNHSFPAPLKQVIDAFSVEWRAKPAAFVCYGGISGGLRAVEQLRQVFAELHVVTIRDTVSLHGVWSHVGPDGRLIDDAARAGAAQAMLNRLVWWARALRAARQASPYAA